jgi:hypothetical protein
MIGKLSIACQVPVIGVVDAAAIARGGVRGDAPDAGRIF